jgi:hypothetical protein
LFCHGLKNLRTELSVTISSDGVLSIQSIGHIQEKLFLIALTVALVCAIDIAATLLLSKNSSFSDDIHIHHHDIIQFLYSLD